MDARDPNRVAFETDRGNQDATALITRLRTFSFESDDMDEKLPPGSLRWSA